MKKERADILLFQKGLAKSREEAKRMILEGKVRIGTDRLVKKASEILSIDCNISIEKPNQFASRAAYKLLPAIEKYPPEKIPFVAADIGASTGGFCDVLLHFGASKIYAVDVGIGQLHPKLKCKAEIISLEQTNARYLTEKEIPEKLDIVTIDVSFISVRKILHTIAPLLAEKATLYVLVKPQFEAQRSEIQKGGVVKDPSVIQRCVNEVANFAKNNFGWILFEVIPSPILGPKGNREQMLVLKKHA